MRRQVRVTLAATWLLPACSGCTLPSYDLQSGLRRAERAEKLLLVEFTRADCPYTAQMDREAFMDAGVRDIMREYIPVRLDVKLHEDDVARVGVTLTPTFVVYRSNGSFVNRHDGAMNADQLRRFLIRAKIAD